MSYSIASPYQVLIIGPRPYDLIGAYRLPAVFPTYELNSVQIPGSELCASRTGALRQSVVCSFNRLYQYKVETQWRFLLGVLKPIRDSGLQYPVLFIDIDRTLRFEVGSLF